VTGSDATRWRMLRENRIETPAVAGIRLTRRRVALLVAGSGLLLTGLVGLAAPGLLPDVGVTSIIAFVLAILALGLGVHAGYRRLRRGERATRFPLVETRSDVGRPGADLDETLREATGAGSLDRSLGVDRGYRARATVRRRVAGVAERVLAHRDGVDAATARAALADGTWTTDPVAGALFAEGNLDLPPLEGDAEGGAADSGPRRDVSPCPAADRDGERNLHTQLSARLGGGPDFRSALEHATASLAAAVPGVDADVVVDDRPLVAPEADAWEPGIWETEHWRGAGSVGLFLLGLAVLAEAPTLVLVAAVVVGYAGYAWLLSPPAPDLAIEREFEPSDPTPGEDVTVAVTVRNEGDGLLPDCRLVDRVPERLSVTDGSARHATALAPGESATFEYDVLAVAGTHEFGDCAAAVRDPSGQRERTVDVTGEGETLACEPAPVTESVPLHPQASGAVGRVPAAVGGSGTAFHAVREYRRGDPIERIDWNRKARTGDLGTLEFEEEHAATVVVVLDRRPAASLAPGPGARSAVDRGRAGASQLLDTLLADGDRVGVATVAMDWDFRPPGRGATHRVELRALLQGDESTSGPATKDPATNAPTTGFTFNPARYRRRLARRLPGDAQVALFTPLCDDASASIARWLAARGHGVTVFSPDPTGTGTVGGTIVGIERALELSALRAAGVRVVDWAPSESLDTAVDRARERWSA